MTQRYCEPLTQSIVGIDPGLASMQTGIHRMKIHSVLVTLSISSKTFLFTGASFAGSCGGAAASLAAVAVSLAVRRLRRRQVGRPGCLTFEPLACCPPPSRCHKTVHRCLSCEGRRGTVRAVRKDTSKWINHCAYLGSNGLQCGKMGETILCEVLLFYCYFMENMFK